jgi:hypothetical protein
MELLPLPLLLPKALMNFSLTLPRMPIMLDDIIARHHCLREMLTVVV